jgi:hypothetical protein
MLSTERHRRTQVYDQNVKGNPKSKNKFGKIHAFKVVDSEYHIRFRDLETNVIFGI